MDIKPTEVLRLEKSQYDQLVKKLPSTIHVSNETSASTLGYMLGVQKVLEVLRDGWVIGE